MTSQSNRERALHTVPASLALQLIELVGRWHLPAEELLAGVGLEKPPDDPMDRVPVPTMCALLERARLLTGEPGLGYYMGLQKRVSVYGYLGFAATSASSVREALELALKFAPMFSRALTIELRTNDGLASLYVHEHADLGSARDIVLISLMFGLHTIAAALTGRAQVGSYEFTFPEPDYYPRFEHLAPRTRFGQPANRILIDAAVLDSPIVTADPTALRLARTLCERQLEELGFDTELVDRVRRLIARDESGFSSLEQVAARIHLSPRTLKRRLAAQGISYSSLLDRERRERALALLRSSRLSIDEVAERLDYSTASTFVRAFHRWTGTTPAAYRRAKVRAPGATTRE
ncbi:MAG TPA: AraC family transcriptional regulator ligand-binding domain-containing protein [Polyangiaceae bacterium]|nr:AraC family transcriptional regulator ligand-binding domain-containing protein [Polyangiaceae bacterium]